MNDLDYQAAKIAEAVWGGFALQQARFRRELDDSRKSKTKNKMSNETNQNTGSGSTTPNRQITAKMSSWNDPTKSGNTEYVELTAVYGETGVNKQWAQSTPSGKLTLGIDNPGAQGFFQKGKEYLITIREAQPGE